MTNGSGTITRNYEYAPFGVQLSQPASGDKNPYRYSGEYYDAESGYTYLRERYYDPAIGRFISEDPAFDGMNWYVYCGNDPVNYHDPNGLARVLVIVGLSGKGTNYSQGNNFVMAANTYKREMKAKGHTVKIIKASKIVNKQQKLYKQYKKGRGAAVANSIYFESAMPALKNSMKNAFGSKGIDIFAYFGHSSSDELSAFFGAADKVTVGEKRWIYADALKYVAFNKGATAYLFGCNAGRGENSIAQKISNTKNITVYAHTDSSIFTDDKTLASYQRTINNSDINKTKFSGKDLWMVASGGMKKFTPKY